MHLPFLTTDQRGVPRSWIKGLAYLDNSGSFKREFRSTNVAYLNARWVTMVIYAAELDCSWAG